MVMCISLLPIFTANHLMKAIVMSCLSLLIVSNWCLHPIPSPKYFFFLKYKYTVFFYFPVKKILGFIWHVSIVKCWAKLNLSNWIKRYLWSFNHLYYFSHLILSSCMIKLLNLFCSICLESYGTRVWHLWGFLYWELHQSGVDGDNSNSGDR